MPQYQIPKLFFLAALQALKRKKRFEQQLTQIDGTLSTIEFQREALENATTNTEVLKNMGYAAKAIKGIHQNMCVLILFLLFFQSSPHSSQEYLVRLICTTKFWFTSGLNRQLTAFRCVQMSSDHKLFCLSFPEIWIRLTPLCRTLQSNRKQLKRSVMPSQNLLVISLMRQMLYKNVAPL